MRAGSIVCLFHLLLLFNKTQIEITFLIDFCFHSFVENQQRNQNCEKLSTTVCTCILVKKKRGAIASQWPIIIYHIVCIPFTSNDIENQKLSLFSLFFYLHLFHSYFAVFIGIKSVNLSKSILIDRISYTGNQNLLIFISVLKKKCG